MDEYLDILFPGVGEVSGMGKVLGEEGPSGQDSSRVKYFFFHVKFVFQRRLINVNFQIRGAIRNWSDSLLSLSAQSKRSRGPNSINLETEKG